MSKNIIIFSDGTGQGGGLHVDESRSNVYKLFRAMRAGPESTISPSKQIAFYDPGLGSLRDADHIKWKLIRRVYNFLSKVTGLGITKNIIDCYAFIIRVWKPGDRIYLFGFSRGAYTVRCLGGVLSLCGVPTQKNKKTISRGKNNSIRIAKEAVKGVYQHGLGNRHTDFYTKQREELAHNFRVKYESADDTGQANVVPYCIGVWDTVAALGVGYYKFLFLILPCLVYCSSVVLGVLYRALTLSIDIPFDAIWKTYPLYITPIVTILIILTCIFSRLRFRCDLSTPWYKTLHLRPWKVKFYNLYLDSRVKYAKHALSIDENRDSFDHVPWISDSNRENKNARFEQTWFSGVHSDIGGSYSETESRLSDIALEWMINRVTIGENIDQMLRLDKRFLHLHPNSEGIQHDERKSSWVFKKFSENFDRDIPPDALLHESVKERFKCNEVVQYDETKPYRPESLRKHQEVKHFYK